MPKLFHLSCSPRTDSESSAGARVFIDRFRQARPDWDIDVMNLWRDHLPEFEGYVLEAKYARINGRAFTDSQRDAFAVTERIALRFALADRVLISTPMWNFGIPYKLKQWIDVITQPGLAFRFDPAQVLFLNLGVPVCIPALLFLVAGDMSALHRVLLSVYVVRDDLCSLCARSRGRSSPCSPKAPRSPGIHAGEG